MRHTKARAPIFPWAASTSAKKKLNVSSTQFRLKRKAGRAVGASPGTVSVLSNSTFSSGMMSVKLASPKKMPSTVNTRYCGRKLANGRA